MSGFLACALKAVSGLALLLSVSAAEAQNRAFPARPITIIVPFAPGGATDIVARLVATRMSVDIGQSVVVDNRAGGAGNIGTVAAVRSAPDGHTVVLATTTQLINHYMMKDLPYNLFTDLAPVALIADAPELLAINAKMPVNTLSEFAEAARTSPSGLNYGSAGVGSVPHVGGEILARAMKAQMVHVPFRGSADAMREVAAGNVHLSIATQASIASFVASGHVKVLAIAAPNRLKTLPDVPTTAEAGLKGVELSNWFGIFAPRDTTPEIVSHLNQAFNKALGDPDIEKRMLTQGIVPVRETPAQFAARLEEDGKAYHAVLKELGLAVK